MSEIKPCPEITQAEIDAGVAVMWKHALDDLEDGLAHVTTTVGTLARLRQEYCDVFQRAYAAALNTRASDACATVQRERDEAREILEKLSHRTLEYIGEFNGRFDPELECDAEMRDLALSARAFLARYKPSK